MSIVIWAFFADKVSGKEYVSNGYIALMDE